MNGNKSWHICTECNKSLPATPGDKHRECPICGAIMRMEFSRRPPRPVITNDALQRAAKWATGDNMAMPVEELEGMAGLLMSSEDRLAVVKTMIAYRQSHRLAKLLSLTDDLEERLFDPEILMQLEAKDLIRALQVLQKGIEQAKDFVFEREPAPVMSVMIQGDDKTEAAAKSLPPESREKIRAAITKFKKQLMAPSPAPAPTSAGEAT